MKMSFFTFMLFFIFSISASAFSGEGSGTENDPYQITNANELQEVNDELDAHYMLMNDIDASDTRNWNVGDHDGNGVTPDSAMGFEPIGEYEEGNINISFTGNLNGQNYVISNLFINRPRIPYVGLFSCITDGGIVKNLGVKDAEVIGRKNSGIFCGIIYTNANGKNVLIENCFVTGSVRAKGDIVGGFCGSIQIENGGIITVTNCYAIASVEGHDAIGIFCGGNLSLGINSMSVIVECFTAGTAIGHENVGAFCGANIADSFGTAIIRDCYSTGSAANVSGIGGFCGENSAGGSGKALIANCYSTGIVSGSKSVGGFTGLSKGGSFDDCYWDIETSMIDSSNGGEGKTTSEMKTQSTFVDWDFDSVWCIIEGETYPHLQAIEDCYALSVEDITNKYNTGRLSIYPNPAREDITLMLNDIDLLRNSRVSIINALGMVVKEFEVLPSGNGEIKLNTVGLAIGIYYVILENGGLHTSAILNVVK